MSDLHLEMEAWRLNLAGWPAFLARHKALPAHPARGPLLDGLAPVDLVVMAGDIHNGLRGIVYAEQVARYLAAPAVYVAGNHEYYHQDMGKLLPAFFAAAEHTKGRVTFLENSLARFEFGPERLAVLGCTLWTDYELNGDAEISMRLAAGRMNDHRMIRVHGLPFMPQAALIRHQKSRLWLHKTMARLHKSEPGVKRLIVTHHAPGAAYLGARTGGIAPAYASDLLLEYAALRPAAWIHGHTHFRHETMEEGIKIASAPRGYVTHDGEAALQYRPGIVEL